MADLERVFEAYGPQDHEAFLDSLRNLDFRNPDWLYAPVYGDPSPWQGDVLPAAEIHYTNSDGEAVRLTGEAMVLSHGCDVVPEQDPTAVLAPVWPVAAYLERLELGADERESRRVNVEHNKPSNLFYLPSPRGGGPDRLVNFSYAGSVSTSRIVAIYDELEPADLLRLSQRGWYLLTGKLAHHYVRAEDSADFPRD